MLTVRESPRRNIPGEHESHDDRSIRGKLATLIRVLHTCPDLGYTVVGSVAVHLIIASTTFDQLWYVQERGFERAHIAQVTGWIGVTGGVLGTLFGGIGSDWWTQHRDGGRARFFFWVMLVLTPLNVAYRLVEPATFLFWLGVFSSYFMLGRSMARSSLRSRSWYRPKFTERSLRCLSWPTVSSESVSVCP